jgi:hypothetical protein
MTMTNSNGQNLTAAMAAVRAATAAINEALAGVEAATASVMAATKAIAASSAGSETTPPVHAPIAHRRRDSIVCPAPTPSGHFCHGRAVNSFFAKQASGVRIIFNNGGADS